MGNALAIAGLQFRIVVKSRSALVTMFGLPLVLTLIFGVMMGSGGGTGRSLPVAVADQDGSPLAAALVAALQGEDILQVQVAGTAGLNKLFADKRIVAGITIPSGFQAGVAAGTAPAVALATSPGGNVEAAVAPVVNRVVARVAGDYRLAQRPGAPGSDPEQAYARIAAGREALAVTVARTAVRQAAGAAPPDFSDVGERAVGFTVLFVMMLVFGMTGVILEERQRGTWGRLLTTPASRRSIIAGYLLSFFVTGMFQFAVLVGASALLFRVNWGPLLPLAALGAAFILCSAGMGLFLAGLVRTPEQQRTVAVLLVNATSMLGGAFWPLDLAGETMRRIGYLTPQAWAIEGFREVMLRGGAWSSLGWPLAVLLALALVFTGAGLLRVRYE